LRDLLRDAALRWFGWVLMPRLELALRSVGDLHRVLEEWQVPGVDFVSLREGFDTKSAAGRLVMNFLASFAEFELSLIRERIADRLARARIEAKRLGRPKGVKDKRPRKKSGYKLRYALRAKAEGR